jgi:hypothetical protein
MRIALARKSCEAMSGMMIVCRPRMSLRTMLLEGFPRKSTNGYSV